MPLSDAGEPESAASPLFEELPQPDVRRREAKIEDAARRKRR
jgi:hypothetical protein